MSKTENCLKLLEILNTGRIYKVDELAEQLETNCRNIPEYKKELELCGYDIISTSGRYGGYYLEKTKLLPQCKLSEEEKNVLLESFDFCMKELRFKHKKALVQTFSKITSTFEVHRNEEDLNSCLNKEQKRSIKQDNVYNFLVNAIENNMSIEILYGSLELDNKTYNLNPYKLVLIDSRLCLIGLDNSLNIVRIFALSKIKEYKILNTRFDILNNLNDLF